MPPGVEHKRRDWARPYILDEPEAALPPQRQLSAGTQFIIATHSPILKAYADALIYQLGPEG